MAKQTGRSACAIQDDYDHWKGHGYDPGAGKPLWLTHDQADWQVSRQ